MTELFRDQELTLKVDPWIGGSERFDQPVW